MFNKVQWRFPDSLGVSLMVSHMRPWGILAASVLWARICETFIMALDRRLASWRLHQSVSRWWIKNQPWTVAHTGPPRIHTYDKIWRSRGGPPRQILPAHKPIGPPGTCPVCRMARPALMVGNLFQNNKDLTDKEHLLLQKGSRLPVRFMKHTANGDPEDWVNDSLGQWLGY